VRLPKAPRDWPRRTTIVATLGPATSTPDRITELIRAGADVFRLNFAHGTVEDHARTVAAVRAAEQAAQHPVAILQDLAGPKIRVGEIRGGALELRDGRPFAIFTRPVVGTAAGVSTTYAGLARDLRRGNRIFLDDGSLELAVEDVRGGAIHTRVVRGGRLRAHKGINIPGVSLRAPTITPKDADDLAAGLHLGVDYVALSFVRRAEDLTRARDLMRRLGALLPIIAKLEKAEALDGLNAIVGTADGVMVARGDLGVEISPEWVPVVQKKIIEKANQAGITVITATQMLESMTTNPRPTRAETSDVANAILDGTDAVMLSAETAVGRYPVEAVRTMHRIACAVESSQPGVFTSRTAGRRSTALAVARAAATVAREVAARAIVVITGSGRTAQLLSKERPVTPLVAFTEAEATARRLALWWGITCYVTRFQDDTDAMILHLEAELMRRTLAEAGDTIVLVGSAPVVARGRTNFLKVHRVRGANIAARPAPRMRPR
jgi:pyruvate kinase